MFVLKNGSLTTPQVSTYTYHIYYYYNDLAALSKTQSENQTDQS